MAPAAAQHHCEEPPSDPSALQHPSRQRYLRPATTTRRPGLASCLPLLLVVLLAPQPQPPLFESWAWWPTATPPPAAQRLRSSVPDCRTANDVACSPPCRQEGSGLGPARRPVSLPSCTRSTARGGGGEARVRMRLGWRLGLLRGWGGPRVAAAEVPPVEMTIYPAMRGWDSPDLPAWDIIMHKERKAFNPGPGAFAVNGSVLTRHRGGLYDHLMADHLRTVCDPATKSCKRKVCALARGDWCKDYYNQEPVPWKPAPRGDKECPATRWGACNGVGSCQHDIGVCLCPAGWGGPDCATRDPRPCTHRYRVKDLDGSNTTRISHSGPDGRDKDWAEPGWTASRCAGYCDEDIAMCFCPPGTKYGHVPAPAGSPPGTPPVKMGRPMADACKPNLDKATGKKAEWGNTPPDDLFGPDGWCNSDSSPRKHCGCALDGWQGAFCDEPTETFCFNQCSGHGDCQTGFCKCHPGWYGMDCSRQRASAKNRTKGDHEEGGSKPYLKRVVVDPAAAQDPPPSATRRRPLIYVYDTDPLYNTKMMQYRIGRTSCVYRLFGSNNETVLNNFVYTLESYFIEMLSVSQHRTYDPEEADFFFVPVQLTCYLWPVLGWADHPWFGMPAAHSRAHQGSSMYLSAKNWIQRHYPFWDRRGGRDHIWMMLNDEGACWMPTEIYNTSIVLSHWGRMDDHHLSGTAWGYDNYSAPLQSWEPYVAGDWRDLIHGHPCYTPGKDLIIPSLKPALHFIDSPLLGAPPRQRDILLYLRGDTGPWRGYWYSRGLRQRLAKLAYKNDWAVKYRIFVGENWQIPGPYSQHLSRSVFCAVLPGDGWSARAEDAILHGCIPLVIMDGVHAVFESILEWDAFAVRLREEAVDEHLPQVLLAFSPEQIERMQRRLALVWQRFAYAYGPLMSSSMREAYEINAAKRSQVPIPPEAEALDAAARDYLDRLAKGRRLQQQKDQEDDEAVPGDDIAQGSGDGGDRGGGRRGLQQQDGERQGGGGGGRDWRGPVGHPFVAYTRFPSRADAWNTIMAWLHSRIPHTRG